MELRDIDEPKLVLSIGARRLAQRPDSKADTIEIFILFDWIGPSSNEAAGASSQVLGGITGSAAFIRHLTQALRGSQHEDGGFGRAKSLCGSSDGAFRLSELGSSMTIG